MNRTAELFIRMRDHADISGCIDLLRTVHEVDGYPGVWPDEPSDFLRPEGLIAAWIALSGPAIIGHVALGAPEECEMQQGMPAVEKAEVKRLFVGPAARGKGVARMLLEIASRYAQTLRLLQILEVTTDGAAAMHLYESAGWRRTGTKVARWSDASGAHPHLYTYEWPASSMHGSKGQV